MKIKTMYLGMNLVLEKGVRYRYGTLVAIYDLNKEELKEIYKVMEYYNALDLTGDSTEYTLRDIFELYCDTQYYDNNIESELIE
ncbi:MAG: hypothetical protein ACRC7S_08130, partial [Cetobacterium sp.]